MDKWQATHLTLSYANVKNDGWGAFFTSHPGSVWVLSVYVVMSWRMLRACLAHDMPLGPNNGESNGKENGK